MIGDGVLGRGEEAMQWWGLEEKGQCEGRALVGRGGTREGSFCLFLFFCFF